jgi:hypothetical protein
MKTKLFTVALAMGLTMGAQAQVTYFSGFENWAASSATFTASPSSPTDWMGSKTTASIVVTEVTTGAEQGSDAINVVSTSATAIRLTTQPVSITQGTAYMISFYAKGKGSIRTGLYSGKTTSAGFGYTPYGPYEAVSSSTNWYKYSQSVVADTTNSAAQFILSIKSTGTSGSITGLDIDSVNIIPYTIQNVSLHDIQYTTASSGNSPYYGKIVTTTGIVTATYSGTTGTQNGFYIQNSNSNAWAGALIYDYKNIVAQGDSVILTSGVDEYYNMTELSSVDSASFILISHNNPLPTPVTLSTTAVGQEMYEGILVTVMNAACVSTSTTSPTATINDGSGVSYTDKQIFNYAFVPGTAYNITGPVNYNYQYSIEPRYAADVVVYNAAGITKYSHALHANVYPNPVANELTIQLAVSAEKINVSVIDMLGREVMTAAPASGTSVSLQNINLPAGVYMVKIMADNNQQLVKITKQ